MTDVTRHSLSGVPSRWVVILAFAVLLIELTIVGGLFKHSIDFTCTDNWPRIACASANRFGIGVYCLIGVLVLLRMLRPAPIAALVRRAGSRLWPIWVNGAGFIIALTPLALLDGATDASALVPALILWGIGAASMLIGCAAFIAPLPQWREFWHSEWKSVLPGVIIAFAAPWLSVRLQPIWSIDWIADQTFGAVTWIMQLAGYDALYADPVRKVIGADGFYITVANVCSGIEGIALVTLFVSLYLWLFRNNLRFPLALLLYPIGIATSILFNILRISILLMIGLNGNPELAVGGFHSHAGWMMFTLVALGIVAMAQTVPALRKAPHAGQQAAPAQLPPFWQDPVVAQILPFAVFMLSALVASTLSQLPSAIYPLRAALMVAVLALVWPFFRRLPWRIDPVAVGVGIVIAAYWILIPVDVTEAELPYGQLTGVLLILWFVARGIGTIVLVPLIEEAFFRGYLEKRLRFGSSPLAKIGAAVFTAVLFAALHGRWAEAFVASLLFSWVAARRNSLPDAILAHAVANALIFAAAIATHDLTIM